jgi:hypothetical protein
MTANVLSAVIAGLDPATPIMWHGRASLSRMAGSSPAMTKFEKRSASTPRRVP